MNIERKAGGWTLPDGTAHESMFEACRHMIACGSNPRIVVRFGIHDGVRLVGRIGRIAEMQKGGGRWVPPADMVMTSDGGMVASGSGQEKEGSTQDVPGLNPAGERCPVVHRGCRAFSRLGGGTRWDALGRLPAWGPLVRGLLRPSLAPGRSPGSRV